MPKASEIYNSFDDSMGYGIVNYGASLARNSLQQNIGPVLSTIDQGSNESRGILQDAYRTAASAYAPQLSASYTALDAYFDALGLPRYAQGAEGFANASKELGNYDHQIGELQGQLNSATNDQQSALREIDYWNSQIRNTGSGNEKSKLAKYVADARNKLNAANAKLDPLKNQLNSLKAKKDKFSKTDPRLTKLTDPEERQAQVLKGLQDTPGYQFNLEEGIKATQSAAAAKGILNSGKTLKDLSNYSQNLANNTYQQYVGNLLNSNQLLNQYPQLAAAGTQRLGELQAQQVSNAAAAKAGVQQQYGTDLTDIELGRAAGLSSIYQSWKMGQQVQAAQNNQAKAYQAGANVGGVK
jgi:hypothetical protein